MSAVPNDDLRKLHALVYPAAAKAIRAFGPKYHYLLSQTDFLDWPTILTALYQARQIEPGPTRNGVSFWLVTWRFPRQGKSPKEDLLRWLVGPSWAQAVRDRIRYDAIQGPCPARPCHRFTTRIIRAGRGPTVRLAFRLADEPTPWASRGAKRRRVRGTIPHKWRLISWRIPTDLEERLQGTDHFCRMGNDLSQASRKYLEEIQDEVLKSNNIAEVKRYRTLIEMMIPYDKVNDPPAIFKHEIAKTTERLHKLQVDRARKAVTSFEENKTDEARCYANQAIEAIDLKDIYHEEYSRLRAKLKDS